MRRRDFLFGISASAITAGCASVPQSAAILGSPVPPVLVSRDRIIETIVGLRPYRTGGFRLAAEPFLGKALVHNYGHGGDGVSLSWGCSTIAAEMAYATGQEDIAIIGAGVMGLTTARILAGWGRRVTIYADKQPPDTTSNIAGALILIPDSYRRINPTAETHAQDARVSALSRAGFYPYVDHPSYGVKRVNHHFLGGPDSAEGALPDQTFLGRHDRSKFSAIHVTPSIYLAALMRDLAVAGVTIQQCCFQAAIELADLSEQTIVNCCGLGAGTLFLDEDVFPIRGQLTLLKPQPEIDYAYIASQPGGNLYMFPREDSIVLGGARDRGDYSLEVKEEQVTRMMDGHVAIAKFARGRPAFA